MAGAEQRIDKWLFFARVVKSRSLAQKLTLSGGVRVNREKVSSVAKLVRPGDVLTVSIGRGIKVLKIIEPGDRRGPAAEAMTLYEDLTPPAEQVKAPPTVDGFEARSAPPTKRERRAMERLRWGEEE